MVFRKFERRVALTWFSDFLGMQSTCCNAPPVMRCLESKYLNTLRLGRPQLELIKRCQPRYRQNSVRIDLYRALSSVSFFVPPTMPLMDRFHWLRRAPCSLSSGTRLLVPGTWTPSAHLPLRGKRQGLYSGTCSDEALGKVAINLPGSLTVYMYLVKVCVEEDVFAEGKGNLYISKYRNSMRVSPDYL